VDIDIARRPIVNDDSRYRRAVRAVWERGYLTWEQWSPGRREIAQPALLALIEWLHAFEEETDLVASYMEVGDAPGKVLRPLLPPWFDDEDVLVLEDVAFCMRIHALRGGR